MKSKMRYLSIALAVTCTLVACEKFEDGSFENLNAGNVEVIGHGGVGFETATQPLPSNSLASISKALEALGADGVEVDVQMTRDSVFYLYHDETLTTKTGCDGCIADRHASELSDCSYLAGINPLLDGDYPLYTLEELLSRYSSLDAPPLIYLDMRVSNACDGHSSRDLDVMARNLHSLLQKYNAHDFVRIESNQTDFLVRMQMLDAQYQLYLDVASVQASIDPALQSGIDGLVVNNQNVSAEEIRNAHDAGLRVIIFHVRSAAGHRAALEKHPDGIQSDHIEIMQQLIE